jgi:hypothetical protein
VQNRLRVDREGRIPPGLAAGLVVLVMVIGALAYSAGRFGRRAPAPARPAELPAPAPVPAVGETLPTPADIPPTVTPSVPVLIEKSSRSSRVLVEKSSQVIVPLPPGPVPTARLTPSPGIPAEESPPRRRIVVEIQATPRPQPTPTVPELEQGDQNEEPAMEETPAAPETTPRAQPRGSPASI